MIFSGSLVDWGDELMSLFTLAIRVETDITVRIDRLKKENGSVLGTGLMQQKQLQCQKVLLDGSLPVEENFGFLEEIIMSNDNTTPLAAREYDKNIHNTIPYYQEFYDQTLDIVEQCGFNKMTWLDLGCGTGSLEELALQKFPNVHFVLVDPSEKMLEKAKEKLKDNSIQYICAGSASIDFTNCFEVVTAIQSHHYMQEDERRKATECIYHSLKKRGIYISFENVIPENEEIKAFELLRWGKYQQRHGKTEEEAKAHNARCGVNYFPLTVEQHIQLLKDVGFYNVHVFWYSYMQMGIYGIK